MAYNEVRAIGIVRGKRDIHACCKGKANMTEDEPKRLVERGYDRIAQRYLAGSAASPARLAYLQKVVERLPATAEVLELGCGAGVPCTQQLAKQADVTGVDISAAQVALAQQHVPTATVMQADMMSLAFPPATFDAIVAFYSLIHLPREELMVLLARLVIWLRPGGWFMANLGVSDNPGSIEPDWLGAPMYWSSYDAQTNLDGVQQAGLTLIETEILLDDEDGENVPFLWILAQKTCLASERNIVWQEESSAKGECHAPE